MATRQNKLAIGNDIDPQPYRPQSAPRLAVNPARRLASAADVHQEVLDLRDADREHFVAFDLNVRHRIITRRVVAIGTLSSVEVHPREVFKPAICNSAAAMIVVHNHPSGDPEPSRQDIELTTRLREVAELCGIPLLDHVIIGSEGYVSLAERGWR
jgi:DNA repair protein RadC